MNINYNAKSSASQCAQIKDWLLSGKTLTSLAKFPKLTEVDAEARKKARIRKFWGSLCGLVIVACVALWLCNVLAPVGIHSPLSCYKEEVEVVEEAPAEAELPAAEETPAE